MTDVSIHPAPPTPHDFLLPPRHRLFAVFDEPRDAASAVSVLRGEGYTADDDVWVLAGDEGRRVLDPEGDAHGLWGRTVRLAERVLAHPDTDYLESLNEELARGGVVLVIAVADEPEADHVARALQALAGHAFAYGAHWDFVPVLP